MTQNIKTSDIAAAGNPDLGGFVSIDDYIDALVAAAERVDWLETDTFTPTERAAFASFLEVVRTNAEAVMEYGRAWMMPKSGMFDANKAWWANRFANEPFIFQPPIQGTSSSLVIELGMSDPMLFLVAKNVSNFMSKEDVVNFLKMARKVTNHLVMVEGDDGVLQVETVTRPPALYHQVTDADGVHPFPHDFIAPGNITKKLDLDPSVLPDTFFEDVETDDLPEFKSLTPQQLATLRTFFTKLRKALNNPSKSGSERSALERYIILSGTSVHVDTSANALTEIVAESIAAYLEMNMLTDDIQFTIDVGGTDADVNVEVDPSADLRTQVRSALEQISVPLARELEYSVFGFDSDAFEVAGELMYFARVN